MGAPVVSLTVPTRARLVALLLVSAAMALIAAPGVAQERNASNSIVANVRDAMSMSFIRVNAGGYVYHQSAHRDNEISLDERSVLAINQSMCRIRLAEQQLVQVHYMLQLNIGCFFTGNWHFSVG